MKQQFQKKPPELPRASRFSRGDRTDKSIEAFANNTNAEFFIVTKLAPGKYGISAAEVCEVEPKEVAEEKEIKEDGPGSTPDNTEPDESDGDSSGDPDGGESEPSGDAGDPDGQSDAIEYRTVSPGVFTEPGESASGHTPDGGREGPG